MCFLKNFLHTTLHENHLVHRRLFKLLQWLNHPTCTWLVSHTQISPQQIQLTHTQQLEILSRRIFILNGKASSIGSSYSMDHLVNFAPAKSNKKISPVKQKNNELQSRKTMKQIIYNAQQLTTVTKIMCKIGKSNLTNSI